MPPVKSSLVCVPDTNVFVHLRDIKLSNRDACLWLWDEFDIKVSDEIPREVQTFASRDSVLTPTSIKNRLNRSIISLKEDLAKMENCFFAPLNVFFTKSADLGERKNSLLSLQLVANNSVRYLIFLTDELKTTRPTGFIGNTFDTYRVGTVWNSLDFLLYLYFRQPRITFLEVKAAIRDVNSRIKGEAVEAGARLVKYNKRLDTIKGAKEKLPVLWKAVKN